MPFEYVLKRSKKRRTIGLMIKNQQLYVLAPFYINEQQIQTFLLEHENWIVKKQSEERINVYLDLQQDQSMYLLGERYPMKIQLQPDCDVNIQDGVLYLKGKSLASIKRLLKNYLQEMIQFYVVQIQKECGLSFQTEYGFFYRKWGSCHVQKRLIKLNYYLACLPKELIKSVIYHEIAHFSVANHQKAFYLHLQKLNPNYQIDAKRLRQYIIEKR